MNTQTNKQLEADIALLDKLLGVEARKPGKAAALPAAIRVIENLEPTGGKDIPVFPASYAGANEFPVYDLGGVEYDKGENGKVETDAIRVKGSIKQAPRIKRAMFCAIDSPQSQANRMEPAFLEDEDLRILVPQATAVIPKRENDTVSVLTLPHRVADFRIRLSDRAADVKLAISAFAKGDALPLLKVFPTSLLFGFWDSRSEDEVGVKHARILLSRIDAHKVVPCRRNVLYSGPYSKDEFSEVILGGEPIEDKKLSGAGFTSALSDGLGGVLVEGKIERISVLSLSDIARINCGNPHNPDQTNAARRYLFALAALAEGYERSKGSHRLRSGCELISVGKPKLEYRGTQPVDAEALTNLYHNRERLISVAKEGRDILGISKPTEYTVTTETLKGVAKPNTTEKRKTTRSKAKK
jgi:CRISPR-associated protein Csb1